MSKEKKNYSDEFLNYMNYIALHEAYRTRCYPNDLKKMVVLDGLYLEIQS